MSAYLMITYDVTDAKRFADYNPGSLPGIFETVVKHGGEAVFADSPVTVTGSPKDKAVCIKFPDADAARAWLDDPDYAPLKKIRFDSTDNIAEYIVDGLG